MSRTAPPDRPLHCACCGRPFHRASRRGPAPLYCSKDCRGQIRVRAQVWRRNAAAAAPHEVTERRRA
ncbi:hypothetical protein [Azospirillum sp. ST 5-10]|uniref:hypothetical protein n=1 Tax=unclassified Azospirillum TaxID=2630922 RepID=UPI003F4A7D0F